MLPIRITTSLVDVDMAAFPASIVPDSPRYLERPGQNGAWKHCYPKGCSNSEQVGTTREGCEDAGRRSGVYICTKCDGTHNGEQRELWASAQWRI